MTAGHSGQVLAASPPRNYERYFVPAIGLPLARDLLGQVELSPGARVLDVGCGTGVVARLAAERVGPRGRVVGLDVNPGMLAVAAAVTAPADTVRWQEASGDAIPYPDGSYDVVLCQLSLQFMPDRMRALSEMYRVLVPGGHLVLNVPGPADPLFQTLARAMARHIAAEAGGFVHAVFSLHEEAEIRELLTNAGFQGIQLRAHVRELSLPPARDFLWQYVGSTPLAAAVAQSSAGARAALEEEVLAEWAQHEDAGRLKYRQRIVVASAQR